MGIGFNELVVILLIVILLFGSKKIPDLAKGIGNGIREFRKASQDTGADKPAEKTDDDTPKKN